jgi:hypothetical protein
MIKAVETTAVLCFYCVNPHPRRTGGTLQVSQWSISQAGSLEQRAKKDALEIKWLALRPTAKEWV